MAASLAMPSRWEPPFIMDPSWKAAIRHLRRDPELFWVPILHFFGFLVVYLGPVGLTALLVVRSGLPDAVGLFLVLASLALACYLAAASIGAVKVFVAASCRQRWQGEDPSLRSAWHETWQHRPAWLTWRAMRHPTDMRPVGIVYGAGDMPMDIAGPPKAYWIVVWLLASLSLGVAMAPFQLAAWLAPSWQEPLLVTGLIATPGAVLYTQGLGMVFAAIVAAARHHQIQHHEAPPGFEA